MKYIDPTPGWGSEGPQSRQTIKCGHWSLGLGTKNRFAVEGQQKFT
jgi:hypothetical protein